MKRYLVKANRLTGWLLLFVIPVLLLTGYGITGRYGWISRMATAEEYLHLHNFLIYVLIAFFVLHGAINIYFAIRRWKKG
ncbi:MAG TPA: hypothetical protein PKZ42_05045 [Syntrophales bacterium]|nr:hypothetical protein [Syntrophales bacterium]